MVYILLAEGFEEAEALIPADGKGDHPSFMILTEASKALEKIGVHLIVTDLSDSTQLWDTIEADQADMWAAAWSATVDPDMYQIYFSGMDGKAAGGSNYMYDINDAELNQLILDDQFHSLLFTTTGMFLAWKVLTENSTIASSYLQSSCF